MFNSLSIGLRRDVKKLVSVPGAVLPERPKALLFAFYSTRSDCYEFLQRGVLPMDHFQSSLPRLPIPKLEKTVERYLNAQRPLLSDSEYNKCKKAAQDFLQEGKGLDKELKYRDSKNKYTSYITKPWFDMYLKDRRSTVITHSPGIVLTPNSKPEYNTQALQATNLLISSLRFLKSLRAGVLEPDVFHLSPKKSDNANYRRALLWTPSPLRFAVSAFIYKAFPLDMSQFVNLFNSTRIPELGGKDSLLADPSANHMLVMRNGNFYVFEALDEQGFLKSPAELHAYIEYILKDKTPPAKDPIGVLTTQDRDNWARLRADLVNSGNQSNLHLVDTAIFCMNLDTIASKDNASMLRNYLHADGTNRWFDKSFQLMFGADGSAAINFEHAWGDGVAVLRYMNEVHKDSTQNPYVHPDSKPAEIDASQNIRILEWKLPDSVKQGIVDARLQFKKRTAGIDLDIVEFQGAGKNFAKKQKISPDALMQMSFQVAYHRMQGKAVASYESCSTAAFKHGRTETIRPATTATKALSEALNTNNKPSPSELRQLIEQCSKYHFKLTKEAAMGQGFDRHLYGLRLIAEEKGGELPALYRDAAFSRINHNIISTSTLSTTCVQAGTFAPVVQDGLGIGYGILENRLGCITTSFKGHANGKDFTSSLESVFNDIVKVLQVTGKS